MLAGASLSKSRWTRALCHCRRHRDVCRMAIYANRVAVIYM